MMTWKKKLVASKLFNIFIKNAEIIQKEKNKESKKPTLVKTKKKRIMLLSKCAVCDIKKLRFMKEEGASGLLCSVEIKTFLSKIPLVGSLLF